MQADNKDEKIIPLYHYTQVYSYFLFAITAAEFIIYEKKNRQILKRHHFVSDSDFADFTSLIDRFNAITDRMLLGKYDSDNQMFSLLSISDILWFLSHIDTLGKMLLSVDNAIPSSLIKEVGEAGFVGDNWESAFLKQAQSVFTDMKKIFKDFPELIDAVTGIQKRFPR